MRVRDPAKAVIRSADTTSSPWKTSPRGTRTRRCADNSAVTCPLTSSTYPAIAAAAIAVRESSTAAGAPSSSIQRSALRRVDAVRVRSGARSIGIPPQLTLPTILAIIELAAATASSATDPTFPEGHIVGPLNQEFLILGQYRDFRSAHRAAVWLRPLFL